MTPYKRIKYGGSVYYSWPVSWTKTWELTKQYGMPRTTSKGRLSAGRVTSAWTHTLSDTRRRWTSQSLADVCWYQVPKDKTRSIIHNRRRCCKRIYREEMVESICWKMASDQALKRWHCGNSSSQWQTLHGIAANSRRQQWSLGVLQQNLQHWNAQAAKSCGSKGHKKSTLLYF